MSLDYPLYEEMKRKGSRSAFWWILGDRLYYVGLIAAIFGIPAGGLVTLLAKLLDYRFLSLGMLGIAWFFSIAVFFLGASLKGYSYKIAKNDGIDPANF